MVSVGLVPLTIALWIFLSHNNGNAYGYSSVGFIDDGNPVTKIATRYGKIGLKQLGGFRRLYDEPIANEQSALCMPHTANER